MARPTRCVFRLKGLLLQLAVCFCWIFVSSGAETKIKVRLVDGRQIASGNVEVYIDYQWGSVCRDGWTLEDAAVVCGMLGFSRENASNIDPTANASTSTITWLRNVNCRGTENSIEDCVLGKFGLYSCFTSGRASVTCQEDMDNTEFMLVADSLNSDILRFDIATMSYQKIPIDTHGSPISMDFDPDQKRLYWRTLENSSIWYSDYMGGNGGLLLQINSSYTHGFFAISHPDKILFYAASGLHARSIQDGSTNTWTILPDEVASPYDIEVDPVSSTIYWSDTTRRSINSVQYSGGGLSVLVNTDVLEPRCIALDLKDRKLYWFDLTKKSLEVINLDGTARKIVFGLIDSNPLDMTIYNNYIYYTDWFRTGVMRISVDGRCPELLNPRGLQKLKGIYVHSNKQNKDNPGDPVSCSVKTDPVRLVNGSSVYKGRVEVLINYVWGGICHDYFRVEDAQVVCTMLGYDRHSARKSSRAAFGSGSGKFWLDRASCTGEEDTLSECPLGTLGVSSCPSGVSSGVICSPLSTAKDFALMAVTDTKELYRMDLSTFSYTAVPISNTTGKPIGITFDPVSETIYWTDVVFMQIRSFALASNTERLIKQLPSDASPDGVAVDEHQGLLFYSNAGIIGAVSKLTLNGESEGTIFQYTGMKPRGLILDKTKRYVYWTDWGSTPSIQKAAYDGTDRQIIVNSALKWPNDLTIDFTGGKLYWCDSGTDVIEVVDLDGSNRVPLVRNIGSHLFSITLYGDYLYYSDWARLNLMRIPKNGGLTEQVGPQSFKQTNSIYIHREVQGTPYEVQLPVLY